MVWETGSFPALAASDGGRLGRIHVYKAKSYSLVTGAEVLGIRKENHMWKALRGVEKAQPRCIIEGVRPEVGSRIYLSKHTFSLSLRF